jgi:hypothetical protein
MVGASSLFWRFNSFPAEFSKFSVALIILQLVSHHILIQWKEEEHKALMAFGTWKVEVALEGVNIVGCC